MPAPHHQPEPTWPEFQAIVQRVCALGADSAKDDASVKRRIIQLGAALRGDDSLARYVKLDEPAEREAVRDRVLAIWSARERHFTLAGPIRSGPCSSLARAADAPFAARSVAARLRDEG